jgi:predicted HicB family RNase H-like nuclease
MTVAVCWVVVSVQPETVPLMVRLPSDLHAKVKACAKENDRSLNAEIIQRLRRSFEGYRR